MNDNPTEKSLNRQLAEALGWRFIPDPRRDDRDSFRVIPDYEHDLKVTLAALHLRERHMQAMLRYSVHAERTECMLLRLGADSIPTASPAMAMPPMIMIAPPPGPCLSFSEESGNDESSPA
jgi:hypothetical protein